MKEVTKNIDFITTIKTLAQITLGGTEYERKHEAEKWFVIYFAWQSCDEFFGYES